MAGDPESKQFAAGYDAGRAMCLATGHEWATRWQIHHQVQHGDAYWQGWSWALWDYEDANGLPHSSTGA